MSRRLAYVDNPARIEDVNRVIHDCFFNVDDISFDSETSILTIGFKREALDMSSLLRDGWLFKKWQIPITKCLLKFYHVKSHRVADTEAVGRYNLLELEYDHLQRRVVVKTGVPMQIEIVVEKLEIEVEQTDTIIGTRIVRSPFDIRKI